MALTSDRRQSNGNNHLSNNQHDFNGPWSENQRTMINLINLILWPWPPVKNGYEGLSDWRSGGRGFQSHPLSCQVQPWTSRSCTPKTFRTIKIKLERKWNKTGSTRFCFSQNKTLKQPWNILAVLANRSRYPHTSTFCPRPLAWRANSWERQWLDKTAKTLHGRSVLFWLKENSFRTVLKLFYFRFISIVRTV